MIAAARLRHVGCHISIRQGYAGAARIASAIGASAFQYFPKNPRGLSVKAFDAGDAAECGAICRTHGIRSIAHTTYATNLAAEGAIREATIRSLRNDLEIAEACGSDGVVVHFGKWRAGADPLAGYRVIISALNETLAGWEGSAKLLIENQAGEGTSVGATLEELCTIRNLSSRPDCIGFCLDTCHLFASGVWDGTNWQSVAENGRRLGFWEHLGAVHLNDSAHPSGSRRDRHANIGQGAIGAAAFAEVLRTPELSGIPVVLETPDPTNMSRQEEIDTVRALGELES